MYEKDEEVHVKNLEKESFETINRSFKNTVARKSAVA